MKDAVQIIYGMQPLMESLHGSPENIQKIIIASGKKRADVEKILALASSYGVQVLFQNQSTLDHLAGGVVHQGVIGVCREFRYASLDEVIKNRHPELKGDIVILADSVTDPHNLGAIIRSAHCFGANGIVIPAHRAAGITPVVMKASAGAVNHIPVAVVSNLGQAIDELKENQFWIYGSDANVTQDVTTVDFMERIGLVIGSEGKGIRPLIRKKCDFLFSIPMIGKIDSLNVSVATGIMLFEILRAMKRR